MSSFLPSFRPFFVKYNSPFQKKGPQPLKSGLLRGNHFQQTLIDEFTNLTQLLSTSFIAKNVDCRLSCQTRYYYYFSGRLSREKYSGVNSIFRLLYLSQLCAACMCFFA